ncbi:unnamed protein product [Pieris macdunnoughi]|uniref:Myb-like domain-containing protein n=1 Tax=Pieris macdunnoughi TaxID=345717 RepID=A0A821PF89_9NEOP|nr:unnamed protein product [Pieris macdunnoughi]
MSTRRARIKAVTALPPRRKNAPNLNNKPEKESPKVSLVSKESEEDNKNTQSDITENASTTPSIVCNKSPILPTIDQKDLSSKTSELPATPKPSNLFAAPLTRNSPKRFASPNLISPRRDVSKCNTPVRQTIPRHHEFNQNTELQVTSNSVNRVQQNSRIEVYNEKPEATATAMDGIVPLQPAVGPKPIEKLKNDIISENAEVLFDPIVPLPSPNKLRPKLRPVPRLGPRRNSIQGSASESEDESRRSLLSGGNTPGPRQRHDSQTILQSMLNRDVSRVRNESVSSSVSQVVGPQMPASPIRDKPLKVRRAQEAASRRAAMASRRKRHCKREDMTMYDLIFYNPTENPILPNEDEMKAKEESLKDLEKQSMETIEESVDAVQESAPAPQIKLGPNGEIILDESSLVIKQTQIQKISSIVREGAWMPSQGKYKRGPRTANWSAPETVRFYRALAAIGTDFTLMAPLFPDRSRKDLKLKFKKEEKINGEQIDKALRCRFSWDAMSLAEEFEAERKEAKRKEEEEKRKQKELIEQQKKAERERLKEFKGARRCKAMKALECVPSTVSRKKFTITNADDLIERGKQIENNVKKRSTQKHTKSSTLTSKVAKSPLTRTPINIPAQSKRQTPLKTPLKAPMSSDMAHTRNTSKTPDLALRNIPSNLETGSLIVLTVNDPKSPGKKMLQTYIAQEEGILTQVALPSGLLNSVVGYMKKGTPKSTVSNTSSPITPNTDRAGSGQSSERKRQASFSITEL